LTVVVSEIIVSTTFSETFTCPGLGNFPYPGSCSLYYACKAPGNYFVIAVSVNEFYKNGILFFKMIIIAFCFIYKGLRSWWSL